MLEFKTMSDKYVLEVLENHMFKMRAETTGLMKRSRDSKMCGMYESTLQFIDEILDEIAEKNIGLFK